MKIPSFGVLISATGTTFKRFYTTILFAVLASVFCILIFHLKGNRDLRYQHFLNVVMSGYLGMLLSLAATLFCERKKVRKPVTAGLQIGAIILTAALTVLYFLLSKKKNIKRIPVSLCSLAILCSFGPWGAFSVSLKSQQKNLFRLLEKNHLLYQNKFRPVKDKIPEKDAHRINSIIEYLVENHGYASLQSFFPQNLDSLMRSERNLIERNSYIQSSKIEALMQIQYSGSDFDSQNQNNFNFSIAEGSKPVRVTGYDFLLTCNFRWETLYQRDSFLLDKKRLLINLDKKTNNMMIALNGGSPLFLNFFPLIESFRKKSYTKFTSIDPEEMSVITGNKDMSVKIVLKTLTGSDDENKKRIEELTADILIKIRE